MKKNRFIGNAETTQKQKRQQKKNKKRGGPSFTVTQNDGGGTEGYVKECEIRKNGTNKMGRSRAKRGREKEHAQRGTEAESTKA